MNNEYYYLNELKLKMEQFIEDECGENEFGYLPDNLGKRMAEAAFAVLQNNKEVTDYLQREGQLK
jgi:hypothetical protein